MGASGRPAATLAALVMLAATGDQPAGSAEIHAIPFELERRKILIEVRVDGKGPFVMNLDTAVSHGAPDGQ